MANIKSSKWSGREEMSIGHELVRRKGWLAEADTQSPTNGQDSVLDLQLRSMADVRLKPQTCMMFNKDQEHNKSMIQLSLWEHSKP